MVIIPFANFRQALIVVSAMRNASLADNIEKSADYDVARERVLWLLANCSRPTVVSSKYCDP